MCWSASVSWAFGCLDLVFVAILLYQKRSDNNNHVVATASVSSSESFSVQSTRFHGTYASFLLSIALQEWAQYFVWKRDNLDPTSFKYCSEPIDYALSFVVMASAQSVPVVLMISGGLSLPSGLATKPFKSFYKPVESSFSPSSSSSSSALHEVGDSKASNVERTCQTWLCRGIVLWTLQFVIILLCVHYSKQYCIQKGPHDHQVWICASAVYQTGGYPLYFASLALYILSGWCALQAHTSLPRQEKEWIVAIACTNGVIAYGMYCWTLEACSIWCWAAFTYGIYFCCKVHVPAIALR